MPLLIPQLRIVIPDRCGNTGNREVWQHLLDQVACLSGGTDAPLNTRENIAPVIARFFVPGKVRQSFEFPGEQADGRTFEIDRRLLRGTDAEKYNLLSRFHVLVVKGVDIR